MSKICENDKVDSSLDKRPSASTACHDELFNDMAKQMKDMQAAGKSGMNEQMKSGVGEALKDAEEAGKTGIGEGAKMGKGVADGIIHGDENKKGSSKDAQGKGDKGNAEPMPKDVEKPGKLDFEPKSGSLLDDLKNAQKDRFDNVQKGKGMPTDCGFGGGHKHDQEMDKNKSSDAGRESTRLKEAAGKVGSSAGEVLKHFGDLQIK